MKLRSNQIPHNEQVNYTELRVIQSAAGFYIGTFYIDPETGFHMLGTRDSSYFITAETAQQYLDAMANVYIYRFRLWINGIRRKISLHFSREIITTKQHLSQHPSDDSAVGYVDRIQRIYKTGCGFFVRSIYLDPLTYRYITSTIDSPFFETVKAAQHYLDAMVEAESAIAFRRFIKQVEATIKAESV